MNRQELKLRPWSCCSRDLVATNEMQVGMLEWNDHTSFWIVKKPKVRFEYQKVLSIIIQQEINVREKLRTFHRPIGAPHFSVDDRGCLIA